MRSDRIYVSSLDELRACRRMNAEKTALKRRRVEMGCHAIKEHFSLSLFGTLRRKLNELMSEYSFLDFFRK